MMKVYNDNIKPEFVGFGSVKIGDTFCENKGENYSVYIKIAHASDDSYKNCINLKDGRLTGFLATAPVRLVDCELRWKFRDMKDKCEES